VEALPAFLVEAFGVDEGDPADPVERIVASSPVLDMRVIHHGAARSDDPGAMDGVEKFVPVMVRRFDEDGQVVIVLGDQLVDDYLAFVAARARRNTHLAVASDLKVFFSVVGKRPAEIASKDVFEFLQHQRRPRQGARVVRLEDGEGGLSARTIRRRLSSVSGLFAYLAARDDVTVVANPVPRGLATRWSPSGRQARTVPLIRTPRTLPRVCSPAEVDALVSSLRTDRDRAMIDAMLLGGLRRCEVLGLGLSDVRAGERRLFVANGKGGAQRIVPVSSRFFASLGHYLDRERPADSPTDRVFVVLKGPRRGQPLSSSGLDEIIDGGRSRAGIERLTCHQLRHTCFTRLREAGMALEAIQAQAGHRSIESTRIYLHLANDWLADEYMRAVQMIDAEVLA
jgi:integrase/recombinase XerD